MSDAIIPLAVEAIWTFSGLAWLELLFSQVCSVLGIVDDIIDVVDSIAGVGGDIIDGVGDFFSSIFRVSATTSASRLGLSACTEQCLTETIAMFASTAQARGGRGGLYRPLHYL
jgi:hypothetical protein